tara:strand:- start:1322 stop:2440 length:1119 start_codon:yes stop_codon:yes gene_type:complete
MNREIPKKNHIEVSVIGSGIAGVTTAFHLGKKGYKVNLIDPQVNSEINNLSPNSGTQAALGVLMGNIYKRSKGRSFILRNKSMRLWKEWLIELNHSESNLKLEKPLIKLASSEKEYQSMIEISENKKKYEIEILDKKSIEFWSSIFEKNIIGGLISHKDGRIDPIKLLKSFMSKLDKIKINKIEDTVIKIARNINSIGKSWKIYLKNDQCINQDYIVICSALNTTELLKPLGHEILLEPILGQVVELELEKQTLKWDNWPAILNYQSVNFIHHNPSHIIMGATVESNSEPNLLHKQKMLNMCDAAPAWVRHAKTTYEWSGIRARPKNEPSPLIKELEPGLLINTGHYRNGILLAPSCAEWVGIKIDEKTKLD